jgi:hypothetical protein
MSRKCDFSGWATRNDIRCTDGRTIKRNAFVEQDGLEVPLVWMHKHDDPEMVLGHMKLENRPEGVYAYGYFNNTSQGQHAKSAIKNGDINSMSIWANNLTQRAGDVLHGKIREVSLVLAGANPGALIDCPVVAHADGMVETLQDEAIIYTGEQIIIHSDDDIPDDTIEHVEKSEDDTKMAEDKEKDNDKERTVQDVVDGMTEEQRNVLYYIVGEAVKDAGSNKSTETNGGSEMKHNVFDVEDTNDENTLSHDEMQTILRDGKRLGSLKEGYLAHADEYGIKNIGYLFPDARTTTATPDFIKRDMGWVTTVMNGVHKTPFSRIKSIQADITEDEARAKGYIKGKQKKEEVFSLLKRSTTPTTIYKKQKLDRDDVVDITDFDVVAWLKTEMRMMLNEEIARAVLIGDGRLASDDDKINESNIRPIMKDTSNDLYAIKVVVELPANATDDDKAKAIIRAIIKARKQYKGSGKPDLFTTEDFVTDALLLEDNIGRVLYEDEGKLATKLRVGSIVSVPVMEGVKESDDSDLELAGIVVNLDDYNIGADKGGEVNMFDDFDIDFNQQKYLIETRCSGALRIPKSALVIFTKTATA